MDLRDDCCGEFSCDSLNYSDSPEETSDSDESDESIESTDVESVDSKLWN